MDYVYLLSLVFQHLLASINLTAGACVGIAYLISYGIAASQWHQCANQILSPFALGVIAKELRGILARSVTNVTRITLDSEPFGLIGGHAREQTTHLIRKLRQAQSIVATRSWVFSPSQQAAFEYHQERLIDFLNRRIILEQQKRAAMPSQEELAWMAKASRIAAAAFAQAHRASTHDSPARSMPTGNSTWRLELGLSAVESNIDVIKKAYRKLASKAHPDRGGSASEMARLNAAIKRARAELQFT